ncbi:hypothetical protein [Campylobacter lanienae]|uniref:hypothetical protein n=1 Tax=Campylobacter lanienae TaxID=75658 RepID=UPI003F017EF6
MIGKNVIIDGTTINYGYGQSVTAGSVKDKKADNNTLTITGGSNVHQFDIAAAKVNRPASDGTSSASGNNLIISGEGTIVKKIMSWLLAGFLEQVQQMIIM